MRIGIVAAGANIIIVASLATLYGLLSGNTPVIGVGLSGLLTGTALLGVGSTPKEGPTEALLDSLRLLLNAEASILEALDLLNASIIVRGGEPPLLILADKRRLSGNPGPGIGVSRGVPYQAIPLIGVGEDISPLTSLDEISLRNALSDTLTTKYQAATLVDLSSEGDKLRISVLGIREEFRRIQGYPLDPLVALTLVSLHKLTGSDLELIDYRAEGNSMDIVVRMVRESGRG